MESLSRRDFRAALDFIAPLGEAPHRDDFASRGAFELNGAIACHGDGARLGHALQRVYRKLGVETRVAAATRALAAAKDRR